MTVFVTIVYHGMFKILSPLARASDDDELPGTLKSEDASESESVTGKLVLHNCSDLLPADSVFLTLSEPVLVQREDFSRLTL